MQTGCEACHHLDATFWIRTCLENKVDSGTHKNKGSWFPVKPFAARLLIFSWQRQKLDAKQVQYTIPYQYSIRLDMLGSLLYEQEFSRSHSHSLSENNWSPPVLTDSLQYFSNWKLGGNSGCPSAKETDRAHANPKSVLR